MTTAKAEQLLEDFAALPSVPCNVFEVAGYPHYENVCSNILAFYLDPGESHGLGDVFLAALVSLLGTEGMEASSADVKRELKTDSGGRLDLLVETDDLVIGIENKIYHHLHNDLADYGVTIDRLARESLREPKKCILSIRREEASHDFVPITYEQYWDAIRSRLPPKQADESNKWRLCLDDFMESIEIRYGGSMNQQARDAFFIENHDSIERLLEERRLFESRMCGLVKQVKNDFRQPDDCHEQRIYRGRTLVHDYRLQGHSVALDLICSSQGWSYELLGRDDLSRNYVREELVEYLPRNPKRKGLRYQLDTYPFGQDLQTVENGLAFWCKQLTDVTESKDGAARAA